MPIVPYSYSVSQDTKNAKVDPPTLDQQIRASSITVALDGLTVVGDLLTIYFKAALSAQDKATLDTVVADHTGQPPKYGDFEFGADGNLKVSNQPLEGNEAYFYVSNLCDKCSWYQGSVAVVEELLTDSGNQTTFNSVHPYWIDLTHGRVFREHEILLENPAYRPVVEVSTDGGLNWTPKVENPWGKTTGDYSIDYPTGTVTFNAPLSLGDLVRASYFYGDSSEFVVEPLPGKRLKVLYVEVQFTKDVELTQDLIFDIRAYNPADPAWNPPVSMPRAVVKQEIYRRIIDFFQESTGPFPTVQAFGGSNDRAVPYDLITLPFNYLAFRDLRSSQGIQVCVRLADDKPLPGYFGNATFYCLSEDE